ncbi:MAG TPA: tyrosine-type recombinase/integrase [Dehalococcoidia bacterium]|nr:tyrosine-type recombinase/integrase [Dehalococcoidia bacterium]
MTCSVTKEKPQDFTATGDIGTNGGKQIKNGPFWTRTRDLSLIRSGEPVKLRNYIDAWYNEQKLKGLTEVTVYRYRQQVEALLNEYPVPSEFDIKSFLTKKQEFGACSGTIANYVKAYRSFFGYLFEKGWYNIDPRCLPLPKVHNRERRVPSDEDVAKLLSVAYTLEDKLALLLLIDCGLRVHELATIKIKNINFDDASSLINGKGGKSRTVYLSETTVKHLREYVQSLKGGYLFPSTRADAKSSYRNRTFFEKRLRELSKRAGVEHITPHQLRHYFATYTLSRGGDIKAVSEMLGHADVTITLKIYHHVNAKVIREMHRECSPLNMEKVSGRSRLIHLNDSDAI